MGLKADRRHAKAPPPGGLLDAFARRDLFSATSQPRYRRCGSICEAQRAAAWQNEKFSFVWLMPEQCFVRKFVLYISRSCYEVFAGSGAYQHMGRV